MPFIRLSDNYIDHPKFLALSASAFRLWHEGMAFCRKHQTDGLIPQGTLQGFRYYQAVRVKELATPYQVGAHPLWETVADFGFRVHDYLFWNLSKEEEQDDRDGATERMRKLRAKRKALGDAARSPSRDSEQTPERSPNVQDRTGLDQKVIQERESERKPIVRGGVRKERPQFTNGRFAVHRWQVDELISMLGANAETFDLDEWLMTGAYLRAEQEPGVVREWWPWLKAETLREAQRRGLPMAVTESVMGKQTTRLASALSSIKRQEAP